MSLKDESFYNEKMEKSSNIDSVPLTQDSLISKLQTIYQSSLEKNLSLSESIEFPVNSSTLFSSNLEEENSTINTKNYIK